MSTVAITITVLSNDKVCKFTEHLTTEVKDTDVQAKFKTVEHILVCKTEHLLQDFHILNDMESMSIHYDITNHIGTSEVTLLTDGRVFDGQ